MQHGDPGRPDPPGRGRRPDPLGRGSRVGGAALPPDHADRRAVLAMIRCRATCCGADGLRDHGRADRGHCAHLAVRRCTWLVPARACVALTGRASVPARPQRRSAALGGSPGPARAERPRANDAARCAGCPPPRRLPRHAATFSSVGASHARVAARPLAGPRGRGVRDDAAVRAHAARSVGATVLLRLNGAEGACALRLEWRVFAAVAELVDAPGLGPGAARREGSSPFGRTTAPRDRRGTLPHSRPG